MLVSRETRLHYIVASRGYQYREYHAITGEESFRDQGSKQWITFEGEVGFGFRDAGSKALDKADRMRGM
jgi:hypothetical protein